MPNLFYKFKAFISSEENTPFFMKLLGLVLVLLIINYSILHWQKPTIAKVDITKIVNQFLQAQLKLNLPQTAVQQRVKIFGHELELTLNKIAKKKHVVLMPSEAVIAGANDLTPEVTQELNTFLTAKK